MSHLYQKGVADNVIINAMVDGETVDGGFSIDLAEPLNFSDRWDLPLNETHASKALFLSAP